MPVSMKPNIKRTIRTSVTQSINLDADEIADILREHLGLPDAEVAFDAGRDFLRGAIFTTNTVTVEEEKRTPDT